MNRTAQRSLALSTLLAAICVGGQAAAAFLILDARGSTLADRYPLGSKAEIVELAPDETIIAMDGAKMRTLSGPGSFQPESGEQAPRELGDLLKRILPTSEQSVAWIGAVRGGGGPIAEDHRHLDFGRGGAKCVSNVNDMTLWRADPSVRVRASIEAVASRRRAFFTWEAGRQIAPWPGRLPAMIGETYLLRLGPATPRKIVLRELDPSGSDAALLQRLLESECDIQAAVLIQARD